MFTAGEVIDGARGLDPSFSPSRHPSRIGLEFLNRYQRRLAGKMLQVEKESISTEISFSLPLTTFTDGVQLASALGPPIVWLEYDRIHGFELGDAEGGRWPLPVVPFKDRFTADRSRYGWLRQKVLYLSGSAAEWVGYDAVIFTYAPTPTTVATPETVLILPDNALDCTVLALGAEMGKRRPKDLVRTTLIAEAKEAEEEFLNLLEEANDVDIGSVRRVFSL